MRFRVLVLVRMISALERMKLELPDEYAKRVMVLTCDSKAEGGSCDVYLTGTVYFFRGYHLLKIKNFVTAIASSFELYVRITARTLI